MKWKKCRILQYEQKRQKKSPAFGRSKKLFSKHLTSQAEKFHLKKLSFVITKTESLLSNFMARRKKDLMTWKQNKSKFPFLIKRVWSGQLLKSWFNKIVAKRSVTNVKKACGISFLCQWIKSTQLSKLFSNYREMIDGQISFDVETNKENWRALRQLGKLCRELNKFWR